jgi:hypothetical protein
MVKKVMGPLPAMYGTNTVQRLLGFHVCWHMMGGEEGMVKRGWPDRSVRRNRVDFYKVFGMTVDDAFPEIAETARALGQIQ